MGATETLARWIVATKYDDIPAKCFEQAKKSILDYIGTATYGTNTQLGKIILEFTREQGGNPQARVIATNIKPTASRLASTAASRNPRFNPCPATGCSVCEALPMETVRTES